MDLYVDSGRKLLNLFHTDLLLENRKLGPIEKKKLGELQNVGKFNMNLMRTFSFGSYSQKYLQLEVDGKQYIGRNLKELISHKITIKIDIKFNVSP